MEKIVIKPHIFFFVFAFLMVLLGLFSDHKDANFNIHDTYFVFNVSFVFYVSAALFVLMGLNYWALQWAEKPAKKLLTILHIILQIIALVPLIYGLLFIDYEKYEGNLLYITISITVGFVLFIISLFIHFINFFISLFSKTDTI